MNNNIYLNPSEILAPPDHNSLKYLQKILAYQKNKIIPRIGVMV